MKNAFSLIVLAIGIVSLFSYLTGEKQQFSFNFFQASPLVETSAVDVDTRSLDTSKIEDAEIFAQENPTLESSQVGDARARLGQPETVIGESDAEYLSLGIVRADEQLKAEPDTSN